MNKKKLKVLLAVSHHYGSDPEYILAGGGNTSYKTEKHLYIKASGVELAHIDGEGFVKLRREVLAGMWGKKYAEDPTQRETQVLEDLLAARERGEEGKRPSVETQLHDLFDEPYVVHTHPPLINALTCSKGGERKVRKLFADEALWIPTVNPGYILAATTRRAVLDYREKHNRDPKILLFQNHGLCVCGENFEDIHSRTESVLEKIRKYIKEIPDFTPMEADRHRAADLAPAVRMLLMADHGGSILVFHLSPAVSFFLKSKAAFNNVSTSITPDHIVYCNHEPLFVPAQEQLEQQYRRIREAIREYRRRNGFAPIIVCVEKLGVFAWGSSKKRADIALAVFLDAVKVAVYSRSFGGLRSLPPDQVDFIKNWEVEAFRRRMSSGFGRSPLVPPRSADSGPVAERIALITGAAQGFGSGIAESLLREGANVVIADLNAPLADVRARELQQQYGHGRCIARAVNVSDETSVGEMIRETVLSYGGLDLLVSNAGVLKAGSLEELDLQSFEFVNRINYTGFFLCCKYASQTMKIQHNFQSDYFMDIVQTNSKSGLSGSNKNFAYAGSKFGGIGLTQSFALELVQFNIKVNAICPGNFFDGPLWSDPKHGLFVQYLRTGKVPGARSIEEVRRFYESKVPMKRGCRVEDVARALLYIVNQTYETGQAMPVTGGQIMLK
jgi:NAD(P)-dependent dehydrogenase (short-subunit alcohol dehydrogenase family)/rhamnose utilization protein RhaD (predicted bifunctional aldolase and dehydrogenase)